MVGVDPTLVGTGGGFQQDNQERLNRVFQILDMDGEAARMINGAGHETVRLLQFEYGRGWGPDVPGFTLGECAGRLSYGMNDGMNLAIAELN